MPWAAQVGNEFSSVEALWSQFENVMDKDGQGDGESAKQGQQHNEQQHGQQEGEKREEA